MREQRGFFKRKCFLYHGAAAVIIIGLILYEVLCLQGEHYYLISLAVMFTGIICGVMSFESGRPSTGLLICISVFTVTAVLSRLLLSPFPQIKPIAAIVILSGCCMGSEAGFMTGMLSMFLSNFYFMQGSWTPFQMFGMGLIGYFAGVLFFDKNADIKRTILICVYGFISVIVLYGGIVDINTLFFTMGGEPESTGVFTVYLAGLPFDLIFAVATVVVLALLYRPVMRIWHRLSRKYEF
ncbi:MAG: ECF transporter S component [Eubacterium sp.]|nr:ECF transporter S component [Eubacterium sp.]